MKQECFSVYDRRTQYFNVPFFSPTIESGKRSFMEVAKNPETLLHRYPEDYELFHVGSFNDETGVFEPMHPVPVLTATQVVVPTPREVL